MDITERINNKLAEYCEKNNIHLTDKNFNSVCKEALTIEEYESCFLSDVISEKMDEAATCGDKLFKKKESN